MQMRMLVKRLRAKPNDTACMLWVMNQCRSWGGLCSSGMELLRGERRSDVDTATGDLLMDMKTPQLLSRDRSITELDQLSLM